MSDLSRLTRSLADRYRIDREVGAGGMATVYLARDLKHDRQVALKVLKPELGAILGVERFLAEIKTTANLHHPNLLPLFDSGEVDGLLFYVMPFVDGESLRTRLDREKQLPVDEAVRIAVAIANALDYAHSHQVIHRDLKPENILLQHGQPVIADFGIALAVSKAGGARITQTGLSLGTPQYMSPEQAAGDRAVDGRSDIYSLAAMTYEMLAGDPPHLGSTAQSIIAKVLTERPPDVRLARPSVPEQVAATLDKALEKLAADRFATAHEFADALEGRSFTPASRGGTRPAIETAGVAERKARLRMWWPSLAGLIVGVLAGGSVARWVNVNAGAAGTARAPALRTTVDLTGNAPLAFESLPTVGYNSSLVAVSPDAATIAYVARTTSGTLLYVRDMSTGVVQPLVGTEGANFAFFSPDGQWIGFLTLDHVKKVPRRGGGVVSLCEANTSVQAWWVRADVIFFTEDETRILSRVSADGGAPERIAAASDLNARRFDDVLPDGQTALVQNRGNMSDEYSDISLANLRTHETKLLVRSAYAARYVSPGFLLFARAGNLLATRFDAGRGRIDGEPVTIASGVAMESMWGILHAASSRNGVLVHAMGGDLSVGKLAWVDRGGAVDYVAGPPEQLYGMLDLAPDGNRIAVHVAGVRDYIWIWNMARREGQRVVNQEPEGFPVWSPDGRRLAGGLLTMSEVVIHDVDAGGGIRGSTRLGQVALGPSAFSRSGDVLAVALSLSPSRMGFVGLRTPVSLPPIDGSFGAFSPDGRWLVYSATVTGSYEVFIRSFPDGKIVRQVSNGGGIEPRWKPSGELFYRNGHKWYSTRVVTTPTLRWDPPKLVFDTEFLDTPGMSYDVSPDGQRLLVVKRAHSGVTSRIEVVTNWFALLERR